MRVFRYRSTNCYFLESRLDGRLFAVDAGWPCTLYEYARGMKGIGLALEDLAWAMVTHFHLDHAGLFGDFARRGVRCYLFDPQAGAIDAMEELIGRKYPEYRRIDRSSLVGASVEGSEELFRGLGIEARALSTPAHSSDSLSVLTSLGEAIVGDLTPPSQLMPGDLAGRASWETLRVAGARLIYPSHAEGFELPPL